MEKKNTPIEIMDAISQLDKHIYNLKLSLEQNANIIADANRFLYDLEAKYNRNGSVNDSEIKTISQMADDIKTKTEETNTKINEFMIYFQKISEMTSESDE